MVGSTLLFFMSNPKNEPASALGRDGALRSIHSTLQAFTMIALIAGLYLAREVLAPLAMSFLLAFLLTPLVKRLEKRLRRVGAVIVTMLGIAALILGGGWLITSQAIDLAQQLPQYQPKLSAKIQSMKPADSSKFDAVVKTLDDLNREMTGGARQEKALRVEMVDGSNGLLGKASQILGPLTGPLGTAGLVVLLTAFILMGVEDLQSRLFRLIGRGRISSTSKALDDASHRVRKYLLMQFIVNFTYGLVLSLGLWLLGIPNALLWGGLACVLRFIPYIGPWIAAAFPIILSLAISPSWGLPLKVLSLFIVIELLSNNVMEPLLYGSSTGVSSFALIVAAVFWTWLWGPIGLVLATPLTVVLVVMGRHVPQLAFLDVMLSEEEALGPVDGIYMRLLRAGDQGEVEMVDDYLEEHSEVSLFDEILIPILSRVQAEHEGGTISGDERRAIHLATANIVQQADFRESPQEPSQQDAMVVWCLPARSERDALSGKFAAKALELDGFLTRLSSSRGENQSLLKILEEGKDLPDILLISSMNPDGLKQARGLIRRIKGLVPSQTIVLGCWGQEHKTLPTPEEQAEAGIEAVLSSVAEAVAFCEGYSARMPGDFKLPGVPENEAERLEAIRSLGLPPTEPDPLMDEEMVKLAESLDMPIAFFSLVDASRQLLLGASGLPDSLDESRVTPRSHSLCGHVVADNETYVIGDIQKNRRFSGNPLLREHGFRFYAGAPVHAPNGQPIGSLCVMDHKPRRLNQRQKLRLERAAQELSEKLAASLPRSGESDRPD